MTDLAAICANLGITRHTYRSRINAGWPIEKALTVPKHGGWGIGKGRVVKKPREKVMVYPLTGEQREICRVMRAWR